MSSVAPSEPPSRQIRLLALAPGAGVVFALLAVGLVVSTGRSLVLLAGSEAGSDRLVVAVVSVVLSAAAAVVTALIAYRLLVEVPRTLRGWEAALAERSRALRGRSA